MKIVMICGSPRPKGSTSLFLLNALQKKLEGKNECVLYHALDKKAAEAVVEELPRCDALVIAFPLYVDSLPSHLLRILRAVENTKDNLKEHAKVYGVVNNGFYDAVQNGIAIDMLWNWCGACGLEQGYALGVGAGEMAQVAPLGHGPSVSLGRAINRLARDIQNRASGATAFVQPNFPRFLYKMSAHSMWRKRARENGLKASAIRRT